jgi:hypothetical protein
MSRVYRNSRNSYLNLKSAHAPKTGENQSLESSNNISAGDKISKKKIEVF